MLGSPAVSVVLKGLTCIAPLYCHLINPTLTGFFTFLGVLCFYTMYYDEDDIKGIVTNTIILLL